MGGKKGPEKNRKYEKDRRNRFNDQFAELHKLLPDINSPIKKVTKAEIINRTIQYLKDSQSRTRNLENDFENEKKKISELQKKVTGLLQIVKELIKLLHKSNIKLPASCPVDDIKSFQETYLQRKRKSKASTSKDEVKKKKTFQECSDSTTDSESVAENEGSNTVVESGKNQNSAQENTDTTSVAPISTTTDSIQGSNPELPHLVKLNSNPLILPQGNLVAVNGLHNAVNSPPMLLINKQVTVPTLILMQNNFVPIVSQHLTAQRSQKMVVPKQMVNTKTTFINKKPIPAVRLFKSQIAPKDSFRLNLAPKRKRCRRSKGILVKYPKRKAPSKNKRREARLEKPKSRKSVETVEPVADENEFAKQGCETNDKNEFANGRDHLPVDKNEYGNTQRCEINNDNRFSGSEDPGKSYSCSDNIFDTPDIPTTGQFIDFFENSASRCVENGNESAPFHENNEIDRAKEIDSASFERSFPALESSLEKEASKENVTCSSKNDKSLTYLPSTTNDSMLLMNDATNSCAQGVSGVERSEPPSSSDKRKSRNKDLSTPLAVHCNMVDNKSTTKDLNLSLIDDKKHYESSFDEFPNDLFTSLQVPVSGQSTDSISPTAAFLQTFPLVSSGANVDLLPEHEEDSNATATTSTTILQIGNLDSPSTLLFTATANKLTRDAKSNEKIDDTYSSYCVPASDKEKKDKDASSSFNFGDLNFSSQLKSTCAKDSQNVPFYAASAASTFPAYNMFTKYNEIPAVTAPYYSFSSQSFAASKATEPEFNSWMPPMYGQDDMTKEKAAKRPSTFKNALEFNIQPELNDRTKTKKKQNNIRPLVNWMTSPDQRGSDASQSVDPFALPKDDSINAFLGSTATVPNNTNLNVSYSSGDYFLDGQSYSDGQLSSCKVAYSSASNNYSWSPSKSTLPTLPLDPHIIPSTLPTLVGDLALGTTSATYNNYDFVSKKYNEATEKKKNTCKNYYKGSQPNSSSFLSVTQLVDDKRVEKHSALEKKNTHENFHYEERDKCYKDGYPVMSKAGASVCKDPVHTPKLTMKCKKDAVKFNMGARCAAKENKKDIRQQQQQQQKSFNDYSLQNCQNVQHKEVNPLTNKNSNYSAESLIGSSSHQNMCPAQHYFSYDSANYGNCGNEYSKKRTDETDPLTSMGYYPNSNYYHNNFQSFNNYGFSNQCYNNYPAQIQHNSFQKKKDENYPSKTDTDWYKESLSYNAMLPADFGSQKLDPKYKQAYSNKCRSTQENMIHPSSYNKHYQCGSSPTLSQSKSSCTFNSTCSFSQSGQQCSEENCLVPNYETKSNRSTTAVNSNPVHPATTLTNFNLSTIFPEINDKHCVQNRINVVGNEKNDPKYGNKVANVDEMNYNYLVQPTAENHSDSGSVYGQSTFQIQHFTDFTNRKTHK